MNKDQESWRKYHLFKMFLVRSDENLGYFRGIEWEVKLACILSAKALRLFVFFF